MMMSNLTAERNREERGLGVGILVGVGILELQADLK